MRRVRVLCGAVVVCVAFELMGQAAPASPKLGETEPSLMMPENASFEIGADERSGIVFRNFRFEPTAD